MEPKNVLIAISNHPPDGWSEEQRKGWDIIEYIPHPSIPADIDSKELYERYTSPIIEEIFRLLDKYANNRVYVTAQGDYSLCYQIFTNVPRYVAFTFPTTERISSEERLPDGSIRKVQIFKFVRWR